jgi:hypothetical protein
MAFWKSFFQRPPKPHELTAEDKSGPARRATVRHPHGRMTFGEIIALPANTPILFKVKDISLGGLGLIAQQPVLKGAFLAVKLEGPNYARTLRARVVHVTQQGKTWLLGCVLIDKLNRDELRDLL